MKQNGNKNTKWHSAIIKGTEILYMSASYKTPDGVALGKWLYNQRQLKAEGKLNSERENSLMQLGMVWTTQDGWEKRFQKVLHYYKQHWECRYSSKIQNRGWRVAGQLALSSAARSGRGETRKTTYARSERKAGEAGAVIATMRKQIRNDEGVRM